MWRRLFIVYLLCVSPVVAQVGDKKGEKQEPLPSHLQPPPSPVLSPAEALASFKLVEGFKIELVASEPLVQDPVALTFDGDGRIWVVEMRGYMPTIDGAGENVETGRISVLEDTDGDGRVDKSTIFLDKLVLPRAIALVKGGALVVAASKLWFAEDTDGDGRADKTTLVEPDYAVRGNIEHQPNGLMRALDNWIYNAKSQNRYRFIDGQWAKQRTEFRGQWGITQDNYGRLFYNVNDSQLRGDVTPPGYIGRNANYKCANGLNLAIATNQHVFPIRMNTGVNRGYRTDVLDAAGRLREFTAACAPVIYRGDNFPVEFQGNAFVCEPGANLIKRNIVFDQGLAISSQFAYPDHEFLASTDERFRPVNAFNSPDGALYIVDMYRGILQHRAYMTTHLRNEILSRGLDRPINLGRIYRIVSTKKAPGKLPRMSKESSMELVGHLSHPNGWWRDTAQRLLVERGDRSVVPALVDLARKGPNPLGRIHALWTLEGLKPPNPISLLQALEDSEPKVRVAAVRVLESLSTENEVWQTSVVQRFDKLAGVAESEVQFQIALSVGNFAAPGVLPILVRIAERNADNSLIRDGIVSGLQNRELDFLKLLLGNPQWAIQRPGRESLCQSLASAVIKGRNTTSIETLLELIGREQAEAGWQRKALLTGIADNARNEHWEPVLLDAEPLTFQRLSRLDDPTVRDLLEKAKTLFEWPGHRGRRPMVQNAAPLTAVEKKLFDLGKEKFQITCAVCHGMSGEGMVPLAPPLVNSGWVLGPEQRLARIVLHGLEGPVHVNGIKYEPPLTLKDMPALEMLDDQALAAVLTYIRREWNHQATPVLPGAIAKIRHETAQRQTPWTESELLQMSN
jgi:glucose/arabinose dehydrogenase/mono/diheme cytochrome c family protein